MFLLMAPLAAVRGAAEDQSVRYVNLPAARAWPELGRVLEDLEDLTMHQKAQYVEYVVGRELGKIIWFSTITTIWTYSAATSVTDATSEWAS